MKTNLLKKLFRASVMQISIVLIAIVSTVSQAIADECNPKDGTQYAMDVCAGADYKVADAKLNATYGKIMKRLADNADNYDNTDTRKLLRTSQRAWITFRDSECDFVSSGVIGGSAYAMIYTECLKNLTDLRIKQLKTYLTCKDTDMSCPSPAQ